MKLFYELFKKSFEETALPNIPKSIESGRSFYVSELYSINVLSKKTCFSQTAETGDCYLLVTTVV